MKIFRYFFFSLLVITTVFLCNAITGMDNACASTLGSNLLTNPGAEAGAITPWTDESGNRWYPRDSSFHSTHTDNYTFGVYMVGGTLSGVSLSQTIPISDQSTLINNGSLVASLSGYYLKSGPNPIRARLILQELDSSGNILGEFGVNCANSNEWEQGTINEAIATGTASLKIVLYGENISSYNYVLFDDLSLIISQSNDAVPTVTDISDQEITVGDSLGSFNFTINDSDTAISSLLVIAISSDQTLLPDAGISIGGSGNSRTISLSPASGQTGETDISITVSDGIKTAHTSFNLKINPVAPLGSNLVTNGDASQAATTTEIPGWSGSDWSRFVLSSSKFTVSTVPGPGDKIYLYQDINVSSRHTLIDAGFLNYHASAGLKNGAELIVKGINQYGTTLWTEQTVNSSSTLQTLSIDNLIPANTYYIEIAIGGPLNAQISNVNLVIPNDLPKITGISNQTISADHNTGAISFSVGYITSSLTISGSSSDQSLVPDANIVFGGSGMYRSVTVTPNSGKSGICTININATDGTNSTSTSFLLTVSPLPVVSSVSIPAVGTYGEGDNLDFSLEFNKAVNVDTSGGTPYISLGMDSGGTTNASYISGSGSSVMLFRYTVNAGDGEEDGVVIGENIVANGGSIQDGLGNAASLTLSGAGGGAGILVDTHVPSGIAIEAPASATSGEPFNLTIEVQDVHGHVATGYRGTISFSSSDPAASLPGNYTFTSANSGIKTFEITFNTTGDNNITVSDTAQTALAGYWTFDEGSGITAADYSGGSNAVTLNGAGWSADRANTKFANSASLNSSGGFAKSDVLPTTKTDNITFSAWIKCNEIGTWQRVAYIGNSASNGYGIYISNTGYIDILCGGVTCITSNQLLPTGSWQHICAVRNNSLWHLYLNGNELELSSSAGMPNTPGEAIYFGGSSIGELFSGLLDDVRLYERPISSFEVKQLAKGASLLANKSGSINVKQMPAVTFSLTTPDTATASTPFNITVEALNVNGIRATEYLGTISFSSSDGDAVLPENYTFMPEDSGVKTFSVTFNNSGNQHITVHDTAQTGLLGYWTFDEGSGLTAGDYSGKGNTATLNGASWSMDSANTEFTNPASLDSGSGYAQSDVLPTTKTDNITLSVWVKCNGIGTLQRVTYIGNSASTGYGIYIDSSGYIVILCGSINVISGNQVLPTGSWQHICAVRNNSLWHLYLNGNEIELSNQAITPNTPNEAIYFGGSGYGELFSGLIDEVRLYERALCKSEIQKLAGGASLLHNNSGSIQINIVPSISSVTASNGQIVVNLNAVPSAVPVISDFSVTMSINNQTASTVIISDITTSNSTVTLTAPEVNASTEDQSVVYNVSYKGSTSLATDAFLISGVSTGSISGTVSDGTNGIAGATVSVTVKGSSYSTTTAADGAYTITGIPPGNGYTVTANKDGYSSGIATGVSVTANTTTQNVNITVSCLVTYRGAQMRTNADVTYDIRFLATIDTLKADAVGFVFSKSEQNPTKDNIPSSQVKSTTTVYNSITAAGSTVTAASLGGTYIIACTVTGIPASQADTPFYVRAFVTKGTETTYTAVRTVTINSFKP